MKSSHLQNFILAISTFDQRSLRSRFEILWSIYSRNWKHTKNTLLETLTIFNIINTCESKCLCPDRNNFREHFSKKLSLKSVKKLLTMPEIRLSRNSSDSRYTTLFPWTLGDNHFPFFVCEGSEMHCLILFFSRHFFHGIFFSGTRPCR